MIKSKGIKIKKIVNFLMAIASKSFLYILIFLFLSLIAGAAIFYKYVFLIEKKVPEYTKNDVILEENSYLDVLKVWQDKKAIFEGLEIKENINPFRRLTK